jgi:hypothetical protein
MDFIRAYKKGDSIWIPEVVGDPALSQKDNTVQLNDSGAYVMIVSESRGDWFDAYNINILKFQTTMPASRSYIANLYTKDEIERLIFDAVSRSINGPYVNWRVSDKLQLLGTIEVSATSMLIL